LKAVKTVACGRAASALEASLIGLLPTLLHVNGNELPRQVCAGDFRMLPNVNGSSQSGLFQHVNTAYK